MNILFMCVANSARSQMAEGLAKRLFGKNHRIESAGSKPSKVNPFAIQVLKEVGFDPSPLYSKSIEELPKDFIERLDYVITLCAEEVCPVIISKARKVHWPLTDPAGKPGSDEEQLDRFRKARDIIQSQLLSFQEEII